MLIYRIEFGVSFISCDEWVKNSGPYHGNCGDFDTWEWLDKNDRNVSIDFYYDEQRHPGPKTDQRLLRNMPNEDDSVKYDFSKFHFGFGSLQKLSHWFDSDLREYMHSCGFICMVYDAVDVIPGSKQSCFNLSTAKPVRMISLLDIY